MREYKIMSLSGCRQGKITFGLIKCKKVDQICKLRMRKGLKNGLIQDLASHIDAVRHDSKFTSKGPRTEKSPSQLFFSKHLNIQLLQITFLKHLMIHHFDSSFTTSKRLERTKLAKAIFCIVLYPYSLPVLIGNN